MENKTFKLLNGDCLDLLKTLPTGSVDMILTDPPYYVGMTHNSEKATFSDLNMLKPFFNQLFAELKRVSKQGAFIYIFTDWRTYPFLQPIMANFFEIKNMLVWDKIVGRVSPHYRNQHEIIIFATNGKSNRKIYSGSIITEKSFSSGAHSTNTKIHPTQKPVELLARLIEDGSDSGDVILDCFMGSGSCGIASLRLGREFIGIEIDENYFQAAENAITQEISLI
ncbi:DNA-methyltransferase [Wielerella bovis]|uniref:DNA-methyltransferase n=1 Tax=Wielerella bovis TaxID=2917790 RepID=UPI00201989E3|nr:site-specific DNA-methyltransferase [Wielerella bovis]ULJ66666.1 site-specific DNA-methyltransferase [Wielerella bovis]